MKEESGSISVTKKKGRTAVDWGTDWKEPHKDQERTPWIRMWQNYEMSKTECYDTICITTKG
jgi:hypothetical protein